jgi:DNA-binding response OmpR family regulator
MHTSLSVSMEHAAASAERRVQVLIADRDHDLVELITHTLLRAGLRSTAAHDETSALELFGSVRPSVVILDTCSVDQLDQFRYASRDAAIIILTATGSEDARVRALEAGADDCLTKPFSHRELLARVRACLRRSHPDSRVDGPAAMSRMVVGQLVVDMNQHLATNDGRAMHLSRTELSVLHYLMVRVGTVVPTHVLMKELWKSEDRKTGNAVRVTVHRLRRKLEPTSLAPRLLETIPHVGFRLLGEVVA